MMKNPNILVFLKEDRIGHQRHFQELRETVPYFTTRNCYYFFFLEQSNYNEYKWKKIDSN